MMQPHVTAFSSASTITGVVSVSSIHHMAKFSFLLYKTTALSIQVSDLKMICISQEGLRVHCIVVLTITRKSHISHVMRKPVFVYVKIKGAI